MNHSITLRLIPRKYWLALGPGWAALGSFLASGVLRFENDFWALNAVWLLKFGLFWLLADPILGTLWHLVVTQGVWCRLTRNSPPEGLTVKPLLPYTVKNSAGYRLSALVALLRQQDDGRWQTSLILPLIALGLATMLGWTVALYALIAILVTFWVGVEAFSAKIIQKSFWQSTVAFLLPYIVGLFLMDAPEQNALLLGAVYWVIVLGMLLLSAGRETADRMIITGQATIAILLFALMKPIAATAVSLGVLFNLLLRLKLKQQIASQGHIADDERSLMVAQYSAQLHLFLLTGFLIAGASLGCIG